MNKSTRRVALAALASFALLAAACGEDQGAQDPTTTAGVATTAAADDPTTTVEAVIGGAVFVTGSSTVEPISVLVGELAAATTAGALAVTVEGPGTGDGFAKFCAGEADISDASRRIKDAEVELCAQAGIEFVELEVAIDGLTVATSPANEAVTCLDYAALYALTGPESEGFSNWTDAQALATELGSTSAPFPDADLVITGPGPESGTYDTYVEFVMGDFAEDRGFEESARNDYTQSPNDNVIVEGIEGSDTSLGWVGYAFYAAEQERLKAIEIDGGEGCVAPTADTISDGSYPLSRSLFIYVSLNALAENPAVGAFVDLYLSDEGLASVAEAGYVDLPAERIEATRTAWADATA